MLPQVESKLFEYFSERLKVLQEISGADWLGVFPRDARGRIAAPVAQSNEMALAPVSSGVNIAECARIGRSRIVHHPVEVSSALSQMKWIRGQAVVPIYFGTRQLGVLDCESTQDSFFTSTRVEELEAISSQIGALWAWESSDQETRITLDRRIGDLKKTFPTFDWCGIYRLEKNVLYLSSFRGAPTPHPLISPEEGICGAAVKDNQTLNIDDVKSDPRYLSCDTRTRSELVVPIRAPDGRPIAEIDIDSHTPGAFGASEVAQMEELARALAPLMIK